MDALTHRTETVLTHDGTLTIDHLPFHAGEAVVVLVLPAAVAPRNGGDASRYPLRGTVIHYIDPYSPVGADDWDTVVSQDRI